MAVDGCCISAFQPGLTHNRTWIIRITLISLSTCSMQTMLHRGFRLSSYMLSGGEVVRSPRLRRSLSSEDPSRSQDNDFDLEDIKKRLSTLSDRRRRMTNLTKRAAVLVPLCHINGVPSLLYTQRTEGLRTHKGQGHNY